MKFGKRHMVAQRMTCEQTHSDIQSHATTIKKQVEDTTHLMLTESEDHKGMMK